MKQQRAQKLKAADYVEDRFKVSVESLQFHKEEVEDTAQAGMLGEAALENMTDLIGYGISAIVALALLFIARSN